MAQHTELKAEKREMLGKKVRRLRRAGILPATVYGHNVTPVSIQVNSRDFRNLLKHQGRTQLIDLVIADERPRPVFIKQTALDAKRNELLHIEFFQANLREKVTTRLPLHLVGDSQAVRDGGILLVVLDHIDIESLPDDVPAGGIEVDISQIEEINGSIHVGDLSAPPGTAIVTPADEVVVKVDPPVAEEVVEEAIAETEELPAELGGDEQPPDSVPEA
ncbi:MAG TPA: 50S ribosomal protein L25 [Chloroflexota bacterium]